MLYYSKKAEIVHVEAVSVIVTLTENRFGYVTNTKIKFIIVVESSNTLLRDNEVRMVSTFLKRKVFVGWWWYLMQFLTDLSSLY